MRSRGNRLAAGLLALFGSIGSVSLGGGLYLTRRAISFHRHAQDIGATVTRKWRTNSYRSRAHYYLAYRFSPTMGSDVSGSGDTDYSSWRSAHVGGSVVVYYLPRDPARNALSRPWFDTSAIIWLIIGVFFTGFSAMGTAIVMQDILSRGKSAEGRRHAPKRIRTRSARSGGSLP
ncbi:MAG TPA: DUF3592 domain-containing protein [Bryobacteraceae bacterium]